MNLIGTALLQKCVVSWVLSGLFLPAALLGSSHSGAVSSRLLAIIESFRERMGIEETILVRVVPYNPKLASSEPFGDGFLISIDRNFLAGLNAEDTRAMLAHEMGHIWIFTHHPYLQTERLANRMALRLVSQESLDRVYERVAVHGQSAR
ncbi:MAG TPA: hypothetical protein VLU25_07920 [Acidobacteriota bacterium]|nr:hypothetical protein [Acidobacteriota bacterium]